MAGREAVMRHLEAAARALGESEGLARRHRGEAFGLLEETKSTRHRRGFH